MRIQIMTVNLEEDMSVNAKRIKGNIRASTAVNSALEKSGNARTCRDDNKLPDNAYHLTIVQ